MEIHYLATGQNAKIIVTKLCEKTQARIGLKKIVTKCLIQYFDKKKPWTVIGSTIMNLKLYLDFHDGWRSIRLHLRSVRKIRCSFEPRSPVGSSHATAFRRF